MKEVPKRFQPLFWSCDINKLDLDENKSYIIHQLLRFGTLKDISWLFKTYGKKLVTEIFVNKPNKNYYKIEYYFVKNYLLGLKNLPLNEDVYVTAITGPVKQRCVWENI